MGCGKDQAAAGDVLPHEFAQALLCCGIERAGRLVKQPDRTLDGEDAGDREPAPLPGGKIGGRQVGKGIEPNRRQRLDDIGGARPKKT